jgi:hypothetical protein
MNIKTMIEIVSQSKLFEREGKKVFQGVFLTDKYAPKAVLEAMNKHLVNQHLTYRHEHPSANPKAEFLGDITKSWMIDNFDDNGVKRHAILFEAEPLTYTENQKTALALIETRIKANEPIGISPGFEQYGVVDGRAWEASLTHIPVCKECYMGENIIMEDNEKKVLEARIDELTNKLNTTMSVNKKYEDEKKALSEKYDTDIKSLHKEYEDVVKGFETYKKQMEDERKVPLLAKLTSLNPSPISKKMYEQSTIADLEAEIKFFEAKELGRPKPVVETLSQSMKKSLEDPFAKQILSQNAALPEAMRKQVEQAQAKFRTALGGN